MSTPGWSESTEAPARLHYSIPEAARELGIGKSTLHRWIADGVITAYQIGGRTFVAPSAMRELVDRQHAAAEAKRADRVARFTGLVPVNIGTRGRRRAAS